MKEARTGDEAMNKKLEEICEEYVRVTTNEFISQRRPDELDNLMSLIGGPTFLDVFYQTNLWWCI